MSITDGTYEVFVSQAGAERKQERYRFLDIRLKIRDDFQQNSEIT